MLRNIKKIGARFTLLNNRKANLTGFTLIELIVVITIIAVLSTIVLITFRTGQEQFTLQRSAHILAQDIRRAQELAMRAEEFHGIIPRGGFGIYLNLNRVVGTYPHLTSYYILFADCNENRSYDGEATICRSLTPGVYFSEQIERREIERGVRITEISTLSPTTIVFIPPDPAIRIRSGGADFTNTIITLSIGNLSERVTVNSAGLIEIGALTLPPSPPPPLSPHFNFSVSVSPTSGLVAQTGSITPAPAINTTLTSGATQSVTFFVSGLPTGATATFSPVSCSPSCSSAMTITTTNTPIGTYIITISAAGGGIVRTTTYTLVVQ